MGRDESDIGVREGVGVRDGRDKGDTDRSRAVRVKGTVRIRAGYG